MSQSVARVVLRAENDHVTTRGGRLCCGRRMIMSQLVKAGRVAGGAWSCHNSWAGLCCGRGMIMSQPMGAGCVRAEHDHVTVFGAGCVACGE